MAWDPETYREKREKVLGIRKRGISFGSLSAIVSLVLLLGFAFVSVPKAVSYIQTRHLDDAIYKLAGNTLWEASLVNQIRQLEGVRAVEQDTHGTRLLVTFDRRSVDTETFDTLFRQKNLEAALLNRVNHRARQATLKSEEQSHHETL
ncbi:MAG: hypothetical protein KKF12_07220 [Proteobacteria bacterium]|nr:hypothetical protein [Desulfobacula sp.]MBU3952758.1 hypothetical protein [Pseudomonadota bacterium]MBU4130594.1 hypothetical protein [Pseudomonadota bacterium]